MAKCSHSSSWAELRCCAGSLSTWPWAPTLLWAKPSQAYLVLSTTSAQFWDPECRWMACSLRASGNPTMALGWTGYVLLQPFFLPDKHWKDCTALYRGHPHRRGKKIHLWSAQIKVFHFTSSSWKTTLPGDVGGVDFFSFFFSGWLSFCCFGGGLGRVFLCCFFVRRGWILLFGVFFQFIFKRQINYAFLPDN